MHLRAKEEKREMKTARTTILRGILVTIALAGLAATGMAQFGNQSAIRDVVRRIQTRTDSLQRAAQNASDRNAYRVDDLNRLISDFEVAVNQLDRRLSSGRANSAIANPVRSCSEHRKFLREQSNRRGNTARVASAGVDLEQFRKLLRSELEFRQYERQLPLFRSPPHPAPRPPAPPV